jgi:putative ABC transport system substrate-binding protein
MRRRHFVLSVAAAWLLTGCGALGNFSRLPATRVTRIGYLGATNNSFGFEYLTGLKQGLAELGYVENQSVVYELRDIANSTNAQALEFAQALVRLSVDVIFALGSPAAMIARQATTATPIVFAGVTDPVGQGLVQGLAHPGGNITGVTLFPATVEGKNLELLAKLMPGLERVAVLAAFDSGNAAVSTLKYQARAVSRDPAGSAIENATRALSRRRGAGALGCTRLVSPRHTRLH